jgi:glycerol-3-phosphate acyltransferase PlsY
MILGTFYVLLAYLLGSIPFGYVVARYLYGMDIRAVGSGNIGATNVYRNLGWSAAVMTVVGDLGKGILPVALARWANIEPQWPAVVGLAAVVGHCFPLFLRFRGGKGVTTTLAILLTLSPQAFLVFIIIWLVVLLLQGRMSLASLSAAATAPLFSRLVQPNEPGMLTFSWVAAVIIFIRHHENVDRLLAGSEKQIFKPIRFW